MNNTPVNSSEQSTVLYTSAFSEITFHPERDLIIAKWKENSKKLMEGGVKDEINRLLDQIVIQHSTRVIVDVRHYAFTSNTRLQKWITTYYVPRLAESNVAKYALVGEKIPADDNTGDEDIKPQVKYFESLEEAISWMD